MLKTKKAFTLAEVLITLLIIGIVSAMIIPPLKSVIGDLQYKSSYRQAFAEATQVWQRMNTEDLIKATAGEYDPNALTANFAQFVKFFSVQATCSTLDSAANCWDINAEKWANLDMSTAASTRGFIDNSGKAWLFAACYGPIQIFIDVNGFKGPNKYGKDRFVLKALTSDDKAGPGYPIKLVPLEDVKTSNSLCHYPPCYYKTWLK